MKAIYVTCPAYTVLVEIDSSAIVRRAPPRVAWAIGKPFGKLMQNAEYHAAKAAPRARCSALAEELGVEVPG